MTEDWYKLPLDMTLRDLLGRAVVDLEGPIKTDVKRSLKAGHAVLGFDVIDGLFTIQLGPGNRSAMAGGKLAGDLTNPPAPAAPT